MPRFLKSRTFKKPVSVPPEIERLCKESGMTDDEIKNIWNCRVYLGDDHFHSFQKMWKNDREGALILVKGWCASHKDKLEIEQQMANFIKNFPDTELSKWGLQDISLSKLWIAGDSINLAVRSLLRRKTGPFTIYTNGTALDAKNNIPEKWNVIGEISAFAEVDMVTAEKMLKWLINSSQYDNQKLLFRGCESSYVSEGENSYLVLS